MKTFAWYSKRPGEQVYHDNKLCPDGNNIDGYYRVSGTGGRPLCKKCADLDRGGE